MMLDDYDKAIAAQQEVLNSKAMVVFSYERPTAIYTLKGDMDKSRVYAAKLLEAKPNFTVKGWSKALYYKNQSDLDRELDALRKVGLPE